MIKKLLMIVACIFLLAGCEQKPKTLVDLNGNSVDFKDYQGKWVVINYWASWCGHCLKELPLLNKFYETHKDKVAMFGVNYDQLPPEQLKPLVKKLNISFVTLTTDPASRLGLGRIDAIPVTYLIDPNGKVSQPLLGEQALQSLQETTGLAISAH